MVWRGLLGQGMVGLPRRSPGMVTGSEKPWESFARKIYASLDDPEAPGGREGMKDDGARAEERGSGSENRWRGEKGLWMLSSRGVPGGHGKVRVKVSVHHVLPAGQGLKVGSLSRTRS